MTKERLFLEYLRDYLAYPLDYFISIYKTLDYKLLATYAKKYPVQKVLLKLKQLQQCI
jgi:hypothetical protein